jgi:[lysine-biosynthesis-protein LysW]--L-2-aminoadipate ligase
MTYDVIRWEEKAIINAAKKRGIEVKLMDAKNQVFNVSDGKKDFEGEVVLQRCVSYFRLLHLTAILEGKGAKVVNSLNSSIVAGNKLFTIIALANAGLAVPKTYLAFIKEGALKALDKLGYPAVIKPTIGSWGRLVALIKDRDTAKALIEDREHMFPLYQIYYLQEKVNRPPRDIRSFVVGDQVVAAIYRIAGEHDWRTNTALGGKAINCPITKELEDLSLKAVKVVGEGIYGVDCMETPNGLIVHEVNNNTEFKNSVPATGVDIPGYIVEYLRDLKKR